MPHMAALVWNVFWHSSAPGAFVVSGFNTLRPCTWTKRHSAMHSLAFLGLVLPFNAEIFCQCLIFLLLKNCKTLKSLDLRERSVYLPIVMFTSLTLCLYLITDTSARCCGDTRHHQTGMNVTETENENLFKHQLYGLIHIYLAVSRPFSAHR